MSSIIASLNKTNFKVLVWSLNQKQSAGLVGVKHRGTIKGKNRGNEKIEFHIYEKLEEYESNLSGVVVYRCSLCKSEFSSWLNRFYHYDSCLQLKKHDAAIKMELTRYKKDAN
jgi:hypothetical protein